MTKTPKATTRPPICIGETDADTLTSLALDAQTRMPEVARLLLAEIDRAKVVADNKVPADTVRMKSSVRFVDEASGVERQMQLVYPRNADIEAGRLSILTPVGAGLIGLKEGQTIIWPDRSGHEHRLRIIAVTPGA